MYSKAIKFIRRISKSKKKSFFISSKKDIKLFEKNIKDQKIFGVDTEFDWRSTYFPKLSLLQISTDKDLFVLDCLKSDFRNIIKPLFESRSCLKVFHSVRSDATVIKNCLDIEVENVFDIQLAEKIINEEDVKNYAKIVSRYFGIKINKNETNSNWLRRPLTDSQINYALDDIDYLIEIYKLQKKVLKRKSIFNKVLDLSKQEANEGNKNFKLSRLEKKPKLSEKERIIFLWREETAEKFNIPPSFIFKNKSLSKLAKIKSKDPLAKKKIMKIFGDTNNAKKFITKFL